MMPAYLMFHLNLAFSSVSADKRPQIIERCYTPLLDLAEHSQIPLGVELPGWTLSEIARLAPAWVARLKKLLDEGRCELIGSGWVQLIGPLVPHEVNQWNQRLALEVYDALLGRRPRIALVNEMAYSASMVDHYADAGYEAILMDRDNARLALGLEAQPVSSMPTHAAGPCGSVLPVLWGDSNLFQNLQRVIHGDKSLDAYLDYVNRRARSDETVLPLYCNDAEVFDFRPGRFSTETALGAAREWSRLAQVMAAVKEQGVEIVLPSSALELALAMAKGREQSSPLNSVSYPVPVKKQAKYNVNRWAVSGRDDLALNTRCHALHQTLLRNHCNDAEAWRDLCEFWASDLRTHITQERWDAMQKRLANAPVSTTKLIEDSEHQESMPVGCRILRDQNRQSLTIETPHVRVIFSLRRGLAIESLGFSGGKFVPVIGTLGQGYFDSIALGADFYSGGVIMEVPADRKRYTDLERVEPKVWFNADSICIQAQMAFAGGLLTKEYQVGIHQATVDCAYRFTDVQRPVGSLRVGILTFLNNQLNLPLTVKSHQGSAALETFRVDREAAHAAPASVLVSSSAALSATQGSIHIEDAYGERVLNVRWDPACCAAMPMLTHTIATPHPFTRLKFSLCELDDTSRTGGALLDFEVQLSGEILTSEPSESVSGNFESKKSKIKVICQ